MSTEAKNTALRTLFTFILMVCFSLGLTANNGLLDKGISREEATADLNFYFKVIDEQHGNPYLYISREEFQQLIADKIEALPEQVSYQTISNTLIELNQKIRCGHTSVTFSANSFRAISDTPNFFPYPVSIIDGELFIDFEDGDLPYGARLTGINGIDAATVLKELSLLPVTDGFIETKVLRDIEKKFGHYFLMRYGASEQFKVSYEMQDGVAKEATVAGTTATQMLTNNYYRPVYKTHERYIHFTHLAAVDSLSTLVMTLNTFNAKPEWFLERMMSRYDEEAQKFNFDNLVIDIRNNEGGDRRLLNILYQLVSGKTLSDPSVNSTRTLDIDVDQLRAVNGSISEDAAVKAEDYLIERFVNAKDGKFATDQIDWYAGDFKLDMDLSQLKFEGQVYVLTSGKTYSAAADLARILGNLDNVKLIGEETGGAHIARTANMLLNYELPNTSMKVQVPVIYEEFVNTNKDNGVGRGTFPDFLVTQTYEDMMNRKDTAFEFALNLIEQNTSLGSN